MNQAVLVIPEISEGPRVEQGLERPLRFIAEVGVRGDSNHFPIEGWDGQVIEGQEQFVGKRVILTRRLADYNEAVVAYIFAGEGADRKIFSGICRAEGLR